MNYTRTIKFKRCVVILKCGPYYLYARFNPFTLKVTRLTLDRVRSIKSLLGVKGLRLVPEIFYGSFYFVLQLTIRLRARVFYEQILNEAQPNWLSLVENEGELSNCFSIMYRSLIAWKQKNVKQRVEKNCFLMLHQVQTWCAMCTDA